PKPGWWICLARVSLAVAVLSIFLAWGAQMTDWVAMGAHRLERVGLLALWMAGAALLYFGVLALSGMKLRSLLRR
ncbi:MAG: lipid II flippase MurJ, partial [Comamonas sp.]|nr:lipid II flippase MurJ [Comamonas sp.]